jgi:hypothetical protein
MTGGTVRDIRTGRAIAKTASLSETFTSYVQGLIQQDEQFYLVYGRCQHLETRRLIDFFQNLDACPVIYDAKMGSDRVFIFEGDPAELGFAV